MSLKGKRIAIFIEQQYEDLEFWYPYLRMKEEHADVVVIGPKVNTYTGKHGLEVRADQSIVGVKAEEFNGLIIPGGYSPDHMRRTPEMVEFVKEMNSGNKWIAAICHGPWMLASAKIIKDKNLTSFFSIKDDLENAGAIWSDQEVMQDGNIITSRSPHDLPAFCRAIIHSLSKKEYV